MALQVVPPEGAQEPPPGLEEDWAEVLAEGLVALRKLSHCPDLPDTSRAAAGLLARTVERCQSHRSPC